MRVIGRFERPAQGAPRVGVRVGGCVRCPLESCRSSLRLGLGCSAGVIPR